MEQGGGSKRFKGWMDECGIRDMGFKGAKYTWKGGICYERLDKGLINQDRLQYYKEGLVLHIFKVLSYHSPMVFVVKCKGEQAWSPNGFKY